MRKKLIPPKFLVLLADTFIMKKRYYLLALFGVILGVTAQTQHWFEDERDVYFPITKEHLQNKVRAQKLAQLQEHDLSAPLLIEKLREPKSLQQAELQKVNFERIRLYFHKTSQPSFAHHHNVKQQHLETQHKLTFLLSFHQAWSKAETIQGFDPKQYSQFLLDLSRNQNESLMVRKQAYKNWLAFQSVHDKASDHRLAQLVSFSDSKMINTLTADEY